MREEGLPGAPPGARRLRRPFLTIVSAPALDRGAEAHSLKETPTTPTTPKVRC